ncbi:MAG: 5-oxoprolinase subunit PxpA [Actinophytocola sp.]|uniref:LamB/YcsF family protein n=1 Tax=Actinophytocola sp. TaxID=1872138 RepID=UPI001328728C|nr:5-oxoprolinase subunit PxpA [Actinophytocola sp.]MPZ84634.1 5-oxoprolinase subunit PxpA [Actinophytocola sp.]
MTELDLNCDVAEGFGAWRIADDDALLAVVSSANIACGFHAGDPGTMRRACETSVRHGVAIGAHVGYRDLAGFGRRVIDVDPASLTDDVLYQLGALSAFAAAAGGRVGYVKPHGALYGKIGTDDVQAGAVVAAVRQFDPSLPVLGMAGSRWLALAEAAGLPTVHEAFLDRGYTSDGRLVSRRSPDALLSDPVAVAQRCERLVGKGEIVAVDGTVLPVSARSVCVHSDTPGSLELARAAHAALTGAGVELRSFV